MPRRDLISIDGEKNYGLNVFDTVGVGGVNSPADVMTVQAMFRYLNELWDKKPEYKGLSFPELNLEPDGLFGQKTIRAILTYQRRHWWSELGIDGKIHPAKYENRNIRAGKRLMTITHMHLELWLAEDTGVDYTKEIARRFPNLAFWIK